MAKYCGKTAVIARPIDEVYSRMADFSLYQAKLDAIPEEMRAKIGDVKFTPDTIVISADPVGDITLKAVERIAPERVVLEAQNSPVPLSMIITLAPADNDKTSVSPLIEVEIPAMLKPFVGPKMQEAADRFGEMLTNLFSL